MYIFNRIRGFLKGWKNQPRKEDVELSAVLYRKKVLNDETLEYLDAKEFAKLLHVSRYANMGEFTAIEAAFCLGYEAGKAGQQNERN